MRALSLTQPWASLVAYRAKRIETRSWPTRYRGPLAIHAAKGFPRDAIELCLEEPFRTALRDAGFKTPGDLPRGSIIATATLENCYEFRADNRIWTRGAPLEEHFGDFTPGRFGFVLAGVMRLDQPIPCRGALGLWEVTAEVEAQLLGGGVVR